MGADKIMLLVTDQGLFVRFGVKQSGPYPVSGTLSFIVEAADELEISPSEVLSAFLEWRKKND